MCVPELTRYRRRILPNLTGCHNTQQGVLWQRFHGVRSLGLDEPLAQTPRLSPLDLRRFPCLLLLERHRKQLGRDGAAHQLCPRARCWLLSWASRSSSAPADCSTSRSAAARPAMHRLPSSRANRTVVCTGLMEHSSAAPTQLPHGAERPALRRSGLAANGAELTDHARSSCWCFRSEVRRSRLALAPTGCSSHARHDPR